METPIWMWAFFLGVVLFLLILDLGILNRKQKAISIRKSFYLSAGYIFMALIYGLFIWYVLGSQSSKEYYTGYIIEKTLSLDNIFVISIIFSYFNIPEKFRHRVLFWGILGVILLRALMISVGVNFIQTFWWALYLFGVVLIATGIKILIMGDKPLSIEDTMILRLMKKYLPITDSIHGEKFALMLPKPHDENKKKFYFTPLFLSLVLIEFVDLIFAIDSLPAIFSITQDSYIIYTSNIFAILGLRALYFSLNTVLGRFKYIKHALGVLLVFIGGKIFIAELFGIKKIPALISLSMTVIIIGTGIFYSLYKTRQKIA